jgi:hypothetical protein
MSAETFARRSSELFSHKGMPAPSAGPETHTSMVGTQDGSDASSPETTWPEPVSQIGGNGDAKKAVEIAAYWTRLRGRRPCPAVSDLDPGLIAAEWPNSILFRCRAGSGALMPDNSFLPQQDSGGGLDPRTDEAKIQLSPLMLQWLVSLAEDSVRNQRPIEDTEAFPSAQKAIVYRAIALPLSDNRSEIDHVLCHVKRA